MSDRELIELSLGGQVHLCRRISYLEYLLFKMEKKLDGKEIRLGEYMRDYDTDLKSYVHKIHNNKTRLEKLLEEID